MQRQTCLKWLNLDIQQSRAYKPTLFLWASSLAFLVWALAAQSRRWWLSIQASRPNLANCFLPSSSAPPLPLSSPSAFPHRVMPRKAALAPALLTGQTALVRLRRALCFVLIPMRMPNGSHQHPTPASAERTSLVLDRECPGSPFASNDPQSHIFVPFLSFGVSEWPGSASL